MGVSKSSTTSGLLAVGSLSLAFQAMTDPLHLSLAALFRYSVISEVIAKIRTGVTQSEAIKSTCAHEHPRLNGSSCRVHSRSVYRWLTAYDALGVHGLEDKPRSKRLASIVLTDKFIDFIRAEKLKDRPASVPELISRAYLLGVLGSKEVVHRSTVYRACQRMGLPLARCRHAKDRDSRRFAHPHRMDMVLCDGKHFRAGADRRKRVALFYLDDATRLVLHVVVGLSETRELFLRGLYECIRRYGFMRTFFVDNGPAFVAADSIAVFAKLEVPLIHGERCYKEGHGKIERFNRTAKADVLRGIDGRADIDASCGSLELRLRHYIDKVYAHRPHTSLDGESPWHRFTNDPAAIRTPTDDQALRDKFELEVERKVSNDHVVSFEGVKYEVPRGYASSKVTLRRRVLDDTIFFLHGEHLIQLHPVDLAANARAKRAKDIVPRSGDLDSAPPTTSAEIAFQREFNSVVDADGGFSGTPQGLTDTE